MIAVYKLTDPEMRSYGSYQWVLGKPRTFPGTGDLCGPGWAHAYTHPLLAVLLNPIHANFPAYRLFEAEGVIGRTDHGLKIGCSRLTLTKELPLPAVTTEQRVRFAIFCALAVYADPSFVAWAEAWLSGKDRSRAAAASAARAAEAAASAAAAAASAARAAAAAWAAAGAVLNLIEIAEAACADLSA